MTTDQGAPEACARCGRNPAEGFATRNDKRYCHGDEVPSCYEQAGLDEWEQRQQGEARKIVSEALSHTESYSYMAECEAEDPATSATTRGDS